MIPPWRNVAGCREKEPPERKKKQKRGKVLNKNINNEKYDYVIIMEIKKIKKCVSQRGPIHPIWASNDQVGRRKERLKGTNLSIFKIIPLS